jgi:hypothetical protein
MILYNQDRNSYKYPRNYNHQLNSMKTLNAGRHHSLRYLKKLTFENQQFLKSLGYQSY